MENNQKKCGNANVQNNFFLMSFFQVVLYDTFFSMQLYMFRIFAKRFSMNSLHHILVAYLDAYRYLSGETVSISIDCWMLSIHPISERNMNARPLRSLNNDSYFVSSNVV